MGLTRTPPQVVYPRPPLAQTSQAPPPQTPTQPGRQPPLPSGRSSGSGRAVARPSFTSAQIESTPAARPNTVPDHLVISSQSSSDSVVFSPLSAQATPVPARPILTQTENGPLNAHINSLHKQLGELEGQKKDLNARIGEYEKKLENEITRRERTIKELAAQHELDKNQWKEMFNAVSPSNLNN